MTTNTFSLGAVLTVTTGRMLVDDIGDLYAILNHMTGDNLFTHQLPRAGDACQEPLLAQLPQLRDVVVPDLHGGDAYRVWLTQQAELLGSEFAVEPIEQWESREPIEELSEMVGCSKPIVAVVK